MELKASCGAIFDLDGVLVDSSSFHFEAWKKLAAEEGFPVQVTEAWFKSTFGKRNDAILATLAGRPLPDEVEELHRRYVSRYGQRKEGDG